MYEEMASSFSTAREEIVQLQKSLANSEDQVAQARQEISNLGESKHREINEAA